LYQLEGYKVLINEFPNKWWTKSTINRLLKSSGTVAQLTDSQENHKVLHRRRRWFG